MQEDDAMLALMLLVLVPAQDDEKAKAIVDKAVAAHGGADKLLRTFCWKEKYYFGDSKDGTVRNAQLRPPEVWWNGGKDIAAGNTDRTDKTYLVWAWTLAPLLEKDSKLALLPDLDVDGRTAAGLKLTREGRRDLSLYFDKESGRLARIDWRTFHITFDDWKEHDGVRYPAKAVVRTNKDKSIHLWTEFLELERLKEVPTKR
jgi:hypothetical protein